MKTHATSCPTFEDGHEVCRSDLALSNIFGHDLLGHKIANAMCREEKRTVEAVAAMSDEEILAIRTLGTEALDRIHERLGRRKTISGTEALQALLDGMPEGPAWNHGRPVNIWEAASEAVAGANEETVRAALGRLLALHLDSLATGLPQVAVRNVRDRDVVLFDGVKYRVVGDVELKGSNGETGYIQARPDHRPGEEPRTFIQDRDVRLPLYRRPEGSSAQPIPQDVSVSDLVRQVIDSGALPAGVKLFGDYGRKSIPGLTSRTVNGIAHVFVGEALARTLSDLLEVSDDDLWSVPGFGEGCMKNLKDSLGSLIRDKEIG